MDGIVIQEAELRKLIASSDAEAALIYLFVRAGGDLSEAAEKLRISAHRTDVAIALLRQLGLLEEKPRRVLEQETCPQYTEEDVNAALRNADGTFSMLLGETQRRLGRVFSTEELKILLTLTNYLGLPNEVIDILVTYCIERGKQRGLVRPPSLRTIQKEAFVWADRGIETLDEAIAYVQNATQTGITAKQFQEILQLQDRRLTAAEEEYIQSWIKMGFAEDAVELAYTKCCANTGGLKWAYINKIFKNWEAQGLYTREQIERGDRKTGRTPGRPAAGTGPSRPGSAEQAAVARRMQKNNNGG